MAGDAIGAVLVEDRDDGEVGFTTFGFIGRGFRNDPNLLHVLSSLSAVSPGGAITIETGPGDLTIGYLSRFSSWMFDSNPSDLCLHLFVSAMSMAAMTREARPKLLAACPTGRPMGTNDVHHALACFHVQRLERSMWLFR